MKVFRCLLPFLQFATVFSIYAEEVGKLDWHQKYIGTPVTVVSVFALEQSNLLISTDRNVLALVDQTTSDIIWRHQLDEEILYLKAQGSKCFTISIDQSSQYRLRSWTVDTGLNAMDKHYTKSSDSININIVNNRLYLMESKILTVIDVTSGEILYKVPLTFEPSLITFGNEKVYLVGNPTNQLTVMVIDSKIGIDAFAQYVGNIVKSYSYNDIINDIELVPLAINEENYIVWSDSKEWHYIKLGDVSNPVLSLSNLLSSELKPSFASRSIKAISTETIGSHFLAISASNDYSLLQFSATGSVDLIHKFASTEANSNQSFHLTELNDGRKVLTYATRAKASIVSEVLHLEPKFFLQSHNFPFNFGNSGDVNKVFGHVNVPKKDVKVIVVTRDGSFHLLKGTKRVWTREESLSHISKHLILELPSSQGSSSEVDEIGLEKDGKNGILSRYVTRVQKHIGLLLNLGDYFTNSPKKNSNLNAVVDKYGFKKLIIFATSTGKLIAMDTLSGKILWQEFMPNVSITQLLLTRDVRVVSPPLVVAIGLDQAKTHIIRFNGLIGPKNGPDTSTHILQKRVDTVFLTNAVNHVSHELVIALVFTDSKKLELYPKSSESSSAFALVKDSINFYITNGSGANRIDGFHVNDEIDVGLYEITSTWSFILPPGEVIASISQTDTTNIASIGRVLGTRSVLYKYLNPNLLAIATLKETESSSTVYVYLFDSLSGTIHSRTIHHGAGSAVGGIKDIHIKACENFVVYTFWNHGKAKVDPSVDTEIVKFVDSKHYEISILEMYESVIPDVRFASTNFSSYEAEKPSYLAQSYVLQHGVSALGVTTTQSGITSREIVLGLKHGQMLGVNRHQLNPRRPIHPPTALEKEELLEQYRPVIVSNPRDMASYFLPVLGITTIDSQPTNLESTSILLGYGLDIYQVRRTPSKPFDMLSEDFSYCQLITSIVVLSIGVQTAKYYATKKLLREAWS
ncbi:hypothetical protein BC833DRAFT_599659 [Globomyces pollinis-pini]|nr:hypothetical protein BC833DRAFT_599659 [Globomyces pollinis-pini]